MPYIAHSSRDIEEMLEKVGVSSIDELFESIPAEARFHGKLDLPPPASELAIQRELQRIGEEMVTLDQVNSFLGGGVYDHYIPSIVDHLSGRAELYTAYTPYQPEASQGTLTAIFEYQSMIAALTDMDVSNASVYDGASALAEAVLMAAAIRRRRRTVVVSGAVHPEHLATVRTYLARTGLKKGDLSKFVNQAVRRQIFALVVKDIKERNADADPDELAELVGEAVERTRAHRT